MLSYRYILVFLLGLCLWVGANGVLSLSSANPIESLQEVLPLVSDITTSELLPEGDRFLQQGMEQFQSNQFRQAIHSWQTALTLYDEADNVSGMANALGNLGIAYDAIGQNDIAIDYHQQSLAIVRDIGNRRGRASSSQTLGMSYIASGQYQKALEAYEQALEIYRELTDHQNEAILMNDLGDAYFSLGQYENASQFYETSLALARAVGAFQAEALALRGLGNVYFALQQYEQAIDLHHNSLILSCEVGDIRGEIDSLRNLGLIRQERGQIEEAEEFYHRSLDIARMTDNQQAEVNLLGDLGNLDRELGQYERAIDFHRQALTIARTIGDLESVSQTLQNLGSIFMDAQQFNQAESLFRQSILTYESFRADLTDNQLISLVDNQVKAFTKLVITLVSQNKMAEALAISERSRTRAFVTQILDNLDKLDLNEMNESDDFNNSLSLDQIRQVAVENNITLVEYSIVSDQLIYIWVVQPSGEISFRPISLSEEISFSGLIESSRTAVGARSVAYIALRPTQEAVEKRQQSLKQLSELLIAPIAHLLPTDPNQPVVFIPQGSLFLVPFPALKADNGDYLIQNHTLLTAPSIQVLKLTHDIASKSEQNLANPKNALIVGNPTMPSIWNLATGNEEQLSSLQGAEQEAIAIANLFKTQALLGDAATEATIKQKISTSDLIHLATHGLLEYGDPQQTGSRDTPGAIALAPTDEEDGLLTSSEILQMDLNADLVVLSACDTGRGNITGDGVIGLSRSFVAAGVPSIIVSLWAVPDAPTAELMTEFYAQLSQGESKAQALRQAMLKTMADHPHPKDWAAFTLIGEDGR